MADEEKSIEVNQSPRSLALQNDLVTSDKICLLSFDIIQGR